MKKETIEFFLDDIISIRESAIMDIAERKDRIQELLEEGMVFRTSRGKVFTTYLENDVWFFREVCSETKKPIAGLRVSFDLMVNNHDIISVE